MKIYTKIVIDIDTMLVIDEVSEEYHGPVALCKGGGSSTTNTQDPVYNAGMLAISQEQQEMADQLFNQYMYGVAYNPNETVWGKTIDGKWVNADQFKNDPNATQYLIENPEWTKWNKANQTEGSFENFDFATGKPKPEPERFIANQNVLEQRTRGDIEGYDPKAQTSEAQYYQNVVNANQSLLGAQTEAELANLGLTMDQIKSQRELLPLKTSIAKEYATRAMEPLNVGQKMDEAQAGVQQAYDLAGKDFERKMFTSGVNASDPGYAASVDTRKISMAKDIAAARTQAKQTAEDTQFSRLQGAMSAL
jgi:hypothetical protein